MLKDLSWMFFMNESVSSAPRSSVMLESFEPSEEADFALDLRL